MNKRESLRARRDRVIQTLRDTGMTDDQIAAELGIESLNTVDYQPLSSEPETPANSDVVIVPKVPSEEIEGDGIIDVEEVDLCGDQPMTSGFEAAPSLPAVVPKPSQYSEEWWTQSKPTVRQHRCKAHRKNGDRCKQPAIAGATVCRVHGGAAKHVKAAARARLENAADLMAKELLGIAIDPDVAPAVKLAAIKDALDRSGLKAPSEVVVSAATTTGFDEVFTDVFTGTREESRRMRGYESPQPNLVDEVLDSIPRGVDQASPIGASYPPPNSYPGDQRDQERDQTAGYYGDDAEHVDSDRPAARHRRYDDDRRSMRRAEFHIVGDDALRIANDTRALPPGRNQRRQ